LDYLGDKFEVEPGNGASREQYLADHKIESFLIVPPKVRRTSKNRKNSCKYPLVIAIPNSALRASGKMFAQFKKFLQR
jgi:adenylate cyclase 2